jgi:CheY-like chemotaxis protein
VSERIIGQSIKPFGSKELQPINLMLLDFQMPRKNGIQVMQEVKQLLKEHQQL